jgi:DNA-binding transcriptional regulator GbsR (MarR family)
MLISIDNTILNTDEIASITQNEEPKISEGKRLEALETSMVTMKGGDRINIFLPIDKIFEIIRRSIL